MNYFPNGDGSTSPASAAAATAIARDKNYPITATPIAGYHFVKWTGSANVIFTNNFSSSTIDDIRVYDRALAPSGISKLYKLSTAKLTAGCFAGYGRECHPFRCHAC